MENKQTPSNEKKPSTAVKGKASSSQAEGKKSGTGMHVVYLLLILAIAGGGIYLYLQMESVKQALAETEVERDNEIDLKEQSIAELNTLKKEYESLKTDNDSINEIVNAKIEEIESLKKKVYFYSRKSYDVSKYKKEIKQLTEALKHTYKVIDSLNVANKYLIDSVDTLSVALEEQLKLDAEKTQEMEVMAKKIDLGSALKLQNLIAEPINAKGKISLKAKKVTGVKIIGLIAENFVVDPGTKTIYARIIDPSDAVLTKSTDNVFEFEEEELIYSTSKDVQYTNNEAKLSIDFDVPGEVGPGTYEVKLFAEGKQIGQTKFILK